MRASRCEVNGFDEMETERQAVEKWGWGWGDGGGGGGVGGTIYLCKLNRMKKRGKKKSSLFTI